MTAIIAFEGIDGSGKTVQMHRLESTLKKRNLHVETLSFPIYGSFFGQQVGRYLTCAEGVSAADVDNKSMALWFALDRFAALRDYHPKGIDVLLLNRYVLSNAVYQSIRDRDLGGPDLLDFVLKLEHEELRIPKPDVYVYFDVAIANAHDNVGKKGFRDYVGNERDVYEAQAGIQLRAREKYLSYAERLDNVLVIPCTGEDGTMRPEGEIAMLVERALMGRGIL